MLNVVFIILLLLFCIQILTIIKLIQMVRQMNRVLFEVRTIFKKSGILLDRPKIKQIQSESCQFCMNRLSFIRISDVEDADNFYYRCKLKNIEITLNDSCESFQLDRASI